MDRFHLYKNEVVEAVQPTPRKDPPGHLATADFLHRRELLAPFSKRLRSTEQVNVLAIGDSIISGESLSYLHNGDRYFYKSGFGGWMLEATASRFRYKYQFLNVEIYDPRNGRWRQITPASAHRKGFYATVLSTTGSQSELTPQGLARIDSYKPDIVLIQPGIHDVFYTSPAEFEQKLNSFVETLLEKKYTVVLGSQTPVIDMQPRADLEAGTLYEHGKKFAAICENIAEKHELPFVDVRAALDARGPRYVGDNFQDAVHPNKRGHRIIGILYYAMLSGEDNKIWQYVPNEEELKNPYHR
jgi:lysophospholipase L1-like esterase